MHLRAAGHPRRLGCNYSLPIRCQAANRCSTAAAVARLGSQQPAAWMHRAAVRVSAMQSGWSPQPQQQPMQQPQQQPLQQPMPNRQPAPLARSPAYQAAPVFLELTQVLNKQVVTRTSGRSLGTISGAWLDPARGTLVSFDLDDRKPGQSGPGLALSSPARAGNIPLSALRQIGDVVLVHDESGLYEQDLDGRLGFVNPVGLDVRTRTGEFLGKVRDLSFSPDSGAVSRVTYDEFGLPFLPISFFDCYSVAMQDVLSIGRSDIIVYDDAKYRERKESAGLFAAIPSLLKSLNGPRSSSPQLALPAPSGTSDMYRLGPGSTSAGGTAGVSASSRYLPADYTYEQWQADLRRWEAETGMTYEQYLRSQSQQQQQAAPRNALPPARGSTPGYPGAAGYAANQAAYGAPQMQPGAYAPPTAQQQQQQPAQQQYPGQQGMQQRQMAQQPLQQQQQQQPQQMRYGVQQQMQPGQYGGAAAQPAAGAAWGPAAGANPYANPAYTNPAATGQGMGNYSIGGSAAAAAAGAGAQRMPQQQAQQGRPSQQQQPLRAAGAAPGSAAAGVNRAGTGAAAAARPGQPPQQQQQQPGMLSGQPQQQQQPGRPVDDWLVRENRPRMADALADGVLPLTQDGAAADGSSSEQQQQVQQQQQQREVA